MIDLQSIKFGKQAAKFDPRSLRFSKYVSPELGPPPKVVSRTRGVRGWGALGNAGPGAVGDCTIAGLMHGIQSWRLSLDPTMLKIPDSLAISYYHDWCGYMPGESWTDQGGNELDVLKLWRKEGIMADGYGHNVKAFAEIDFRDTDQVKRCIDLFGWVYLGLALPRSIADQNLWSVASGNDGIPGTLGGHAVIADNYDQDVIVLQTWGEQQEATWQWFLRYCDESHAVVSDTDWKNPEGFDRDELLQDLAVVTE